MTTVAFDGKTMAADAGMVMNGVKIPYRRKMRRLKKGGLAGFCGTLAGGQLLLDWLDAGKLDVPFETPDECEADVLWVKKNGEVWLTDTDGVLMHMDPGPVAIGSGGPIALGAMLAGATAAEAVKIAIERDPNSGFDVISLDL